MVPIPTREVTQGIPTTAETIGAIVIIPIKWVDSAVNQIFYMLIPIRGVNAAKVPVNYMAEGFNINSLPYCLQCTETVKTLKTSVYGRGDNIW